MPDPVMTDLERNSRKALQKWINAEREKGRYHTATFQQAKLIEIMNEVEKPHATATATTSAGFDYDKLAQAMLKAKTLPTVEAAYTKLAELKALHGAVNGGALFARDYPQLLAMIRTDVESKGKGKGKK